MKYIVLSVSMGPNLTRELPIIFPDCLVHRDVFDAIRLGSEDKSMRRAKVVAAGFVSSMSIEGNCNGRSETLDIKSRGKVDDQLMKMFDYTHGIKS